MIKVVVVDDSPDLREIVRYYLERRNWKVFEAADGSEAVPKLRESQADMLVLDLLMPIQDGYTTLEEIRSHPEFADLPVLVLTSLGRESAVVRAFKLGASDFLRKPFSPEELYFRLVRLVPQTRRHELDLD